MEALERELALRRMEDIFDEIGDERLARMFFPNGLDGDKGDLEEMARALAEHGITEEVWEAAMGGTIDPAEIRARTDESERRLIDPRRERILYYARRIGHAQDRPPDNQH
jgi:hypothetical protein